jgi:hypothetical protein
MKRKGDFYSDKEVPKKKSRVPCLKSKLILLKEHRLKGLRGLGEGIKLISRET